MASHNILGLSAVGLLLAGLTVSFMGCTSGKSDGDSEGKGGKTSAEAGSGNDAGSDSGTGGKSGGIGGQEGCDPPCEGAEPAPCTVVTKPGDALITDWEDVDGVGLFVDNDTYSSLAPNWWDGFFGGPFVYPGKADLCKDPTAVDPAFMLTQSTTGGVWSITGQMEYFGGFGLWLEKCMIDFSDYDGLEFDISGNVGPSEQVTVMIATDDNAAPDECRTNIGQCTEGTCRPASAVVTVPAAAGTPVRVLWTDFADGSPVATLDPSKVRGIQWELVATTDGIAYDVNVTVDNIRLITAH